MTTHRNREETVVAGGWGVGETERYWSKEANLHF